MQRNSSTARPVSRAKTWLGNLLHRRLTQTEKMPAEKAANDLLKAILAHDVKAVSKLLSLHPETLLEVEYPEHEGKRPLQMAAVVGSPEIVTLLISAGAEVNSADSSGATAAHIAAQLGEMKILRILIEADADMNARTKRARETPLHLSFVDDRVGVVALLVDAGADINARDVQGETPLHEAAAYGARRSVGFLLATGADTSIRDSRGRTPHDMVCLCLQFVNIPQMLQCSEEQCEEEDIAALVDSLEADFLSPVSEPASEPAEDEDQLAEELDSFP